MKKKAIVVIGPTASGKTSLGVYICKKFNGEVVSCDSMQIYKEMGISTAKPTPDEMDGIKHHLIDFLSVSEKYSVSDYCSDARKAFDAVVSGGKLPVFVGGTGLYIDSFLSNTKFLDDASSDDVRFALQKDLSEKGIDVLYSELLRVDPKAAEKIHKNNTKRVLRALEVYRSTGKTLSQQEELSHIEESDIEPLYIGITYKNRELLYERINRRVDLMVEAGLVEEARELYSLPYSETAVASIGCKEIKPFLDGEKILEECIDKLKQNTRNYAKRQLTWFRRNEKINWVYPDECSSEEIYKTVDKMIIDYLAGEELES
ncbi:MAG: tRNA (adenosine(37)-N6)-dimethylallyltransferase MiaA [Clostridia bacterium]|nr:tRNA (adenosine(37)-N6)-dimethylallyltransferase MiaA [Clostridia bacterium]